MHLYMTGGGNPSDIASLGVIGVGPGAYPSPFEINLPKGDVTLTALVDNLGRFAGGNDIGERTGLFGHLLEIKPFRAGKPKLVEDTPIDPFVLRGYIEERAKGQLSASEQLQWTFTHTRKSPILIDVKAVAQSGTFVLNDEPVEYYAGSTGAGQGCFIIGQTINESFKRGKNVLRFAPDAYQDASAKDAAQGITLYEGVEVLSEGAAWAFARWERPEERAYEPITKTGAKRLRNSPAWWRCRFRLPAGAPIEIGDAAWLDLAGLSKGQVFVNNRNLGRYFTQTATGKKVGPQTRLAVPASWLQSSDDNELVIFDEHGFDPYRVRLRLTA